MKIKLSGELEINYEKKGEGPHAVMLLPGTFGTIEKDFAPLLANMNYENFTIVSWDPVGYGKSRPPKRDFMDFDRPRKDADLVVELMQKLGFQRFSILGFCSGGATGLILAANYPDIVDKFVCWGTKAFVSDEDKTRMMQFSTGELDVGQTMEIEDVTKTRTVSHDANIEIYGVEECKEMYKNYAIAFNQMNDICTGYLSNVKCPVLILHGACDDWILDKHPRYLHENIKGSTLHIFPTGKHFLQHKPEFVELVEKFLLQPNVEQ